MGFWSFGDCGQSAVGDAGVVDAGATLMVGGRWIAEMLSAEKRGWWVVATR